MRALTFLSAGPMRHADAVQLASVLKALADPTRLQLLALLADGEQCCSDLNDRLGRLKQPTVSHHLGVLVAAGLVRRRPEGVFVWHTLTPVGLAAVVDALAPGGAR